MEVKTLTSTEHAAATRAATLALIARLPAGWQGWSAHHLAAFKDAVDAFQRARKPGEIERTAAQVQNYYAA